MPPTGNPYPWWMSGIASAASTIPGSVATFWSCSSERSRTIAESSSSSANTRAGTRMSGRASAGISYSVSSMRRGSDIEHDPSVPHAVLACEVEAVIRRRLDERLDTTTPPDERRCERRSAEPQPLCALRHEALRVGEEDQLLEPGDEERAAVIGRDAHLVPHFISTGIERDELAEGSDGLLEDALFALRVDRELDVRRMAPPLIHGRTRLRSSRRRGPRTRPRPRAATRA